jgi:hypothetical protein
MVNVNINKRLAALLPLALATLLLAGCGGGGGPAADEGKKAEEVRETAKSVSDSRLQEIVGEYRARIAAKQRELTALGGKTALLTKQGSELSEQIRRLELNLGIYVEEAAGRKK